MRDALVITLIIIFLAVSIGYIYNLSYPYLVSFGVLEPTSIADLTNDGGIFRSVDAGLYWRHATGVKDDGNRFLKSDVFDIKFVTGDPDRVYAATSNGLYTSGDSGDNWQRLVLGGALLPGESVRSLAIDPQDPQRVYVASYITGNRGRILKSRGLGFYEVYSTLLADDKVLGIWIDPADPTIVFAGTREGLFLESTDFGESWIVRSEFEGEIGDVRIVPGSTEIIYAVIGGNKLKKTDNRGNSWIDISSQFSSYGEQFNIYQIAIDQHSVNRIYAATSAGLLRSENGGASFSRVGLLAPSQDTSVYAVEIDPQKPDVLYIGVNSQIHTSSDLGESWQVKNLNTGRIVNVIKVKPDDSRIIFSGVVVNNF